MPNFLNNILHKIGVSIERFPNRNLKRRIQLVNYFEINLIFDIGASIGKFAKNMRKLGYDGKIVSFEPLSESFTQLFRNSQDDENWDIENLALGDFDGEGILNVAGNSDSSSLLNMLPKHVKANPRTRFIGTEKIKIYRLDSIIKKYWSTGKNIYLKIDTQGYEDKVLLGAEKSLDIIRGIQLELSLIKLYEKSKIYTDMIEQLYEKGYRLYSIEPGFTNSKTGQLLQFDGIFFNNQYIKS